MKLICSYADCCLPDYWGGHHLAHICVPVDKATTATGLRRELAEEIRQEAWAGSDDRTQDNHPEADEFHEAALEAVQELEILVEYPFPDIEPAEDGESCYAYFVFQER